MGETGAERMEARAAIAIEAVTGPSIDVGFGVVVASQGGADGLACMRGNRGIFGAPMEHDRAADRYGLGGVPIDTTAVVANCNIRIGAGGRQEGEASAEAKPNDCGFAG